MKAATQFLENVKSKGIFEDPNFYSVRSDLYGSLALTGPGHGTDKAVLLGLMGETPETVDIKGMDKMLKKIKDTKKINLLGLNEYPFLEKEQLVLNKTRRLKYHTNGMKFTVLNKEFEPIYSEVYYSIGGGFIMSEEEMIKRDQEKDHVPQEKIKIKYKYRSMADLQQICKETDKSIMQVVLENEWPGEKKKKPQKDFSRLGESCKSAFTMAAPRKEFYQVPKAPKKSSKVVSITPFKNFKVGMQMEGMDWVNLYALAVSEQNAAGCRVVTAPTNGSCGIIPAVMHYYDKFLSHQFPGKIMDFMLASSAVGIVTKYNASISGAEGGCQGEVGTACAMAAAGLTAALGGTNLQIENAAEIGIEHNLGLTCDPVAGLVQIPCIERNTMGAIKAINAAKLALGNEEGSNRVSYDRVIKVMKNTGDDMRNKYKETALGGLAAEFEKDL
eukprot:CAMPEP_0114583630 /NCGR_PEP_ID=MMETSP0125-20121206/7321_1 /TAXON_ID=485358 ORGANISM="Aristerostoma sp., Strain ATCC 50986" /NCGR_SAMPLE_ID=MMETSP0125 /ASSEMBLY_ACC=CAM_ASM_000245 /LENGTH=443 /DNA_ID=CAMNT_0001777195 /DNA_START=72 /DNA_END=1406 /DNA_ORIENTATION=+